MATLLKHCASLAHHRFESLLKILFFTMLHIVGSDELPGLLAIDTRVAESRVDSLDTARYCSEKAMKQRFTIKPGC